MIVWVSVAARCLFASNRWEAARHGEQAGEDTSYLDLPFARRLLGLAEEERERRKRRRTRDASAEPSSASAFAPIEDAVAPWRAAPKQAAKRPAAAKPQGVVKRPAAAKAVAKRPAAKAAAKAVKAPEVPEEPEEAQEAEEESEDEEAEEEEAEEAEAGEGAEEEEEPDEDHPVDLATGETPIEGAGEIVQVHNSEVRLNRRRCENLSIIQARLPLGQWRQIMQFSDKQFEGNTAGGRTPRQMCDLACKAICFSFDASFPVHRQTQALTQ